MKRKSLLLLFVCLTLLAHAVKVNVTNAVDFVNPLVGSDSNPELSTGNTYPAIAMPWGMNFWVPQTGKMGDGWQYTYSAKKIRGLKQTHQQVLGLMIMVSSLSCLPWVNRSLMRRSEPAGSLTRQRRLYLIIIVSIWQTMM